MAISSTAILFGSLIFDAISNIATGNAAKKQAEFQAQAIRQQTGLQAQVTEEQAAREREIAKAEEDDFRRNQARVFGEKRAAFGASGVRLDTGSPILAAFDFALETELQASRIRSGGQTVSSRLKQQADLIRLAGLTDSSLLSAAGKNAQLMGFFRAGSSLLSGAGTNFS